MSNTILHYTLSKKATFKSKDMLLLYPHFPPFALSFCTPFGGFSEIQLPILIRLAKLSRTCYELNSPHAVDFKYSFQTHIIQSKVI